MSNTYNIELTTTEDLALSFAALSQDDWIQNAVHERCRVAIEDVVAIAVQKCFETNTVVPATKDELVALAFTQGWVKTAAQRQAEFEAAQAAKAQGA